MNKSQKLKELVNKCNDIIGKTFSNIDQNNRLSTGKGGIGNMIEESYFEIKPNNKSAPDFDNLDIELKVAPFRKLKKNKISAKERIKCNSINFFEEVKKDDFKSSSFYKKCKNLIIMFYEHIDIERKGDGFISYVGYLTFNSEMVKECEFFISLPEEDVKVIRQDWKTIVNKIKEGLAHDISEGDTLYLGACTHGSNANVKVKQPFSNILAKPRAFSLKQKYVSYVLNNYVLKAYENNKHEKIIKDIKALNDKKIEELIIKQFENYYGKSDIEISKEFNINIINKGFRNKIIASILGIKGNNIENTEEFLKADIKVKTIRVKNGKIRESMSFPKINFGNLIENEWEESDCYNQIGLKKFMFVIFLENNGVCTLKKVMFWNIPSKDLDQVKIVWKKIRNLVKNNKLQIGGKYGYSVTNFPKISNNNICHVRPHDRDSKTGRVVLNNGVKIINYCFWLNSKYLKKIINLGK